MYKDIHKTQHFTTRANEMIMNLFADLPQSFNGIEPFYGAGDLLNHVADDYDINWEYYDLDLSNTPENVNVIEQDTLAEPPNYSGKYVITNPPYLARNKTDDKEIFDQYGVDDLYKAAVLSALEAEGGIYVIPLNFFTDKRSAKVREAFLHVFDVHTLNVFLYPTFDFTNYQTCAFSFTKRKPNDTRKATTLHIYHSPQNVQTEHTIIAPGVSSLFSKEYDQTFTHDKTFAYHRIVEGEPIQGDIIPITFYLTDKNPRSYDLALQGNYSPGIHADYGKHFVGKHTSRNECSFSIVGCEEEVDWLAVCDEWNKTIADFRRTTHNICLTNFRDAQRKRLSFGEALAVLDKVIVKHIKTIE